MSTSKIISIVPRLPPAIDGVGDYALRLAQQLRKDYGVETRFVVVDPSWIGEVEIDSFPIYKLETRSSISFLETLDSASENRFDYILIQYANYAYDRWGCPFWLIKGLKKKVKTSNQSIVTMFHELYNNTLGPPWKHGFWAIPQQKKIAVELANMSNYSVTNSERYANVLRNSSSQESILVCPVFSNITEPLTYKPLSRRSRKLVIFGQERRRKAYTQSIDYINQICQILSIESIVDIGSTIDINLSNLTETPIEVMGKCSEDRISAVLLNSWVGFLNYADDPLTKSGVFAAYCAHGLIPITHNADVSPNDNLISGETYWNLAEKSIDSSLLQKSSQISKNAHRWYQHHDIKQHGRTFYNLMVNRSL